MNGGDHLTSSTFMSHWRVCVRPLIRLDTASVVGRLFLHSAQRSVHRPRLGVTTAILATRPFASVKMPTATNTSSAEHEIHSASSKRLVLCFDGTGNKFLANPSDTNIVKLYNLMDRGSPDQMHYYQPGIGTYPAEGPVNVGFFRGLIRSFQATIDAGFATSFDSHVIAGYKFVMRYYRPGDRIYVFGFSRGAFTARFLSRMISHIGLLSIGNEEMVNFAYQVYQDYEKTRGDGKKAEANTIYMNEFKRYFCRDEREQAEDRGDDISANESGIKVHFLGLFDCVSSVGNLDASFFKKMPPLPPVNGTAEHVRHAVAIDERRVKFKAALFAQEEQPETEDIKEVWFPGNHCDIGGGYSTDGKTAPSGDVNKDKFQLSDIALKWMIDELDDVEHNRAAPIAWDKKEKESFLTRFADAKHQEEMVQAKQHDTMKFGGGSGFFKILLWNFLEYFPFIKRWEYVPTSRGGSDYKWDYIAFPLNMGGCRDIPSVALFHHAVRERILKGPLYKPRNHVWVKDTTKDKLETTNFTKVVDDVRSTPATNGAGSGSSLLPLQFHKADKETVGSKPWDQIYRLGRS